MVDIFRSIGRQFKYAIASIRHPGLRDFADMGLGIEARHARCKRFWAPHLECCTQFQQNCIDKNLNLSRSIAILGSGALLDVDWEYLTSKFERIDCYDANPLAYKSWSKLSKRSKRVPGEFILGDLSGAMERWSQSLHAALAKEGSGEIKDHQIADILGQLTLPEPTLGKRYDVVLSLNIMSQIPLYWRDRVSSTLLKVCRRDSDPNGNYSLSINKALEKNFALLQEQHCAMLSKAARHGIILITDREWLYYQRSHSPWLPERSLYYDPQRCFSGLEQVGADQWFWHIAPQGLEQQEYGVIHDVMAGAWRIR